MSKENHRNSVRATAIRNSAVTLGNRNIANIRVNGITLPQPHEVDIRVEIAALREALVNLTSADTGKIKNAIADAELELSKDKPERSEIASALSRALDYAKKATEFEGVLEAVKPHVISIAGWLGRNYDCLLAAVGLGT